jgi:DNA-binding GntR family transcriptional regulator
VAASGNAILTRLHDSLRDRQRRMVTATVRREPGTARRYLAEHRGVIDAIDAGDGPEARRRLTAHLESAWRGIEHMAATTL